MELAVAELNLNAVHHNLTQIKKLAPHSRILAMIKADGYGHGMLEMAQAMSLADALGVARINEAIELRKAGVKHDIVLMEGCYGESEYRLAEEHELQTTIHSDVQLNQFLQIPFSKPIKVWLKLDTGMHRLGFTKQAFQRAYKLLSDYEHCLTPITMMSHFACADDLQHPLNQKQTDLFLESTEELNGELSMANSAAILTRPDTHLDWVRPGIITYGSSPVAGTTAKEYFFKPVMTFKSRVIAIQHIAANETIGYGGTWRANTDSTIAVVGIGYGDGYPRHAKSGTPILINGREYPLVGRVSMDMITVDISEQPNVAIGDSVVLWGDGLPAERVASYCDTISYQLFCGITKRVRKRYLKKSAE